MWGRGWIDPFEELRKTVERLNRMLVEGFETFGFREAVAVDVIDEGGESKSHSRFARIQEGRNRGIF
jgi:hypothetical protein